MSSLWTPCLISGHPCLVSGHPCLVSGHPKKQQKLQYRVQHVYDSCINAFTIDTFNKQLLCMVCG